MNFFQKKWKECDFPIEDLEFFASFLEEFFFGSKCRCLFFFIKSCKSPFIQIIYFDLRECQFEYLEYAQGDETMSCLIIIFLLESSKIGSFLISNGNHTGFLKRLYKFCSSVHLCSIQSDKFFLLKSRSESCLVID